MEGASFARTCGLSWAWFWDVPLAFRLVWVQDVMEPTRTGEEDKEEECEKDEDEHHRLLLFCS